MNTRTSRTLVATSSNARVRDYIFPLMFLPTIALSTPLSVIHLNEISGSNTEFQKQPSYSEIMDSKFETYKLHLAKFMSSDFDLNPTFARIPKSVRILKGRIVKKPHVIQIAESLEELRMLIGAENV